MAHILNELPLPMGLSQLTAAYKKCHVSPRMGQLAMDLSQPVKKLHAIPHMGQLAIGLSRVSRPTAACEKLHASPHMGQLAIGSHGPIGNGLALAIGHAMSCRMRLPYRPT